MATLEENLLVSAGGNPAEKIPFWLPLLQLICKSPKQAKGQNPITDHEVLKVRTYTYLAFGSWTLSSTILNLALLNYPTPRDASERIATCSSTSYKRCDPTSRSAPSSKGAAPRSLMACLHTSSSCGSRRYCNVRCTKTDRSRERHSFSTKRPSWLSVSPFDNSLPDRQSLITSNPTGHLAICTSLSETRSVQYRFLYLFGIVSRIADISAFYSLAVRDELPWLIEQVTALVQRTYRSTLQTLQVYESSRPL